jgi:hypothetical protein
MGAGSSKSKDQSKTHKQEIEPLSRLAKFIMSVITIFLAYLGYIAEIRYQVFRIYGYYTTGLVDGVLLTLTILISGVYIYLKVHSR